MPPYQHPGVYVEEIKSGSMPIEGVGTSTAAFVGYAIKGPIGEPKMITKWDDFDRIYGGVRDLQTSSHGDPMGLSVSAFFQNGGAKAYIVRITEDFEKKDAGASHAAKAVGYVDHPGEIGKKALKFTAANEGAWANEVVVKVLQSKVDADLFDVHVGKESKDQSGNVTFAADETITAVSLDESNDRFIKKVVDGVSEIVTVDLVSDVTTLSVYSDQYMGTSTSGDLTDVSIDFSGGNRKIKITLDGAGAPKTITLDQKSFADLDALAANIQEKVRELDAAECYSRFTCVARDKKLVFVSGSRESSSSVEIDDTYGAAQRLKLGIPDSDYTGSSTSGDLSGLSSFDLNTEDNAANRSLTVSIDGAAPVAYDLGRADFTGAAVAQTLAAIRDKLNSIIDGVTCSLAESDTKLKLTSDTHHSTSAVVVASDLGVAPTLHLGVDPDDHGGEELTGQQNHERNQTRGSSIGEKWTTSLDLTGVAESERTVSVSVYDGSSTSNVVYTFAAGSIGNVEAVRSLLDTNLDGVSCKVTYDNRLVLVSDAMTASATVVVDPSGVAEALKLGAGFGFAEIDGATNHNLNYRTELTGQERAESSIAKDKLDDGVDGGHPTTSDYEKIFTKFVKYRDINTICLPGKNWPKDKNVSLEGLPEISLALAHAEKMKNRMVIIDLPPSHELTDATKVKALGLPSQTYCVAYYPWINTANRFYHAERNPGVPMSVLVPPSGYAAGMWAKIDGKRGVWKAAAGMETGLLGVSGTQFKVEDDEQDSLNPWGVNCLRNMPGGGPVVWGARTLATKADPEWRYVPVRRTAHMIEQSIYEGIQWAVFEPNDHRLWSALRANIGNFMNGLFRAGAFQGEKASDAYFVRCNLDDTMTQGDIDAGQVIAIVGFAPLKPAEFVIVRIQQKVNLNQ